MKILAFVLVSLVGGAVSATAGDVYRGYWGGSQSAPIAIEISSDGKLANVCNFGQCFPGVQYERDGETFVLTNGSKRWTFVKAPRHPGYNAVYWENNSGWTQVAGAKLDLDVQSNTLERN